MNHYRSVILIAAAAGVALGITHALGGFENIEETVTDISQNIQGEPPTDRDTTPPTIEITTRTAEDEALSPDRPIYGILSIGIQANDAEGEIKQVSVRLDNEAEIVLPSTAAPLDFDTTPLVDGTHTLVIQAEDQAGNMGTTTLAFNTDNTPPTLQLSARSEFVSQGRTLPVLMKTDASVVMVYFLDKEHPVYPLPGSEDLHRTLVGIPLDTEARDHPLFVTLYDEAGNRVSAQIDVEVEEKESKRHGYFRDGAGSAIAATNDEIKTAKEARSTAQKKQSPSAMWTGTMRTPVEGRRLKEFGNYDGSNSGARRYNYGLDISAGVGTPVGAAASGTVTLARHQVLFGNTVIVDHGHGVSSSYNHLKSIAVQNGDTLRSKDIIGEVGASGQSVVPHVHWAMTVGGVPVDPIQWTEEDFLPTSDDEWNAIEVRRSESSSRN